MDSSRQKPAGLPNDFQKQFMSYDSVGFGSPKGAKDPLLRYLGLASQQCSLVCGECTNCMYLDPSGNVEALKEHWEFLGDSGDSGFGGASVWELRFGRVQA